MFFRSLTAHAQLGYGQGIMETHTTVNKYKAKPNIMPFESNVSIHQSYTNLT